MDLDTIRILIESGVDCNIRCQPEKGDERDDDEKMHLFKLRSRTRLHYEQLNDDFIAEKSYSIYLAAISRFNNQDAKAKMILIIETLLRGGVDPFLICNNEDSILHYLARQSSILEPFLAFSDINLEARDSKGICLLDHMLLSWLLRQLSGRHRPSCISTRLTRRLNRCS